jgi:hypothetical protein
MKGLREKGGRGRGRWLARFCCRRSISTRAIISKVGPLAAKRKKMAQSLTRLGLGKTFTVPGLRALSGFVRMRNANGEGTVGSPDREHA